MLPEVGVRLVAEDANKFDKDLNQASKSLGQFGAGATETARFSLTELKSGLDLASGAFRAVENAVKSVIDPFVAYANQVEDLGRNSGLSAKESSLLLNVTDDLRIGFDTLKIATKELNKDGIQPSFKTLRDLAKQYQAIKDPVERARFATAHFGRSAQELTKFLETSIDTLDDMADSVEHSGLVIDESGIQKAKDYQKSLDDWEDSVLAVKIALAEGLLPALSSIVTAGSQVVQIQQKQTNELIKSNGNLLELVQTYTKYAALSAEVVWTDKTLTQALGELNDETERATPIENDHGEALSASVVDTRDYAAIIKRLGDDRRDAIQSTHDNTAVLYLEAEANKAAAAATEFAAQHIRDMAKALEENRQAAADARLSHLSLAETLKDATAVEIARAAIEGLNQMLRDGKITPEEYARSAEKIALAYDIVTPASVAAANALDTLNKLLDTGKIAPEEYAAAVDKIKPAAADGMVSLDELGVHIVPLSEKLADAKMQALELGGAIDGLHDKTVTVTTNFQRYGDQSDNPGFASGTNFIVPPGYPNDSFNMRVESGERVIVVPREQALHPAPSSISAGNNYNYSNQGPSVTYAPTYIGTAPPVSAGFATISALWGSV